jgi:hypothetical protein
MPQLAFIGMLYRGGAGTQLPSLGAPVTNGDAMRRQSAPSRQTWLLGARCAVVKSSTQRLTAAHTGHRLLTSGNGPG